MTVMAQFCRQHSTLLRRSKNACLFSLIPRQTPLSYRVIRPVTPRVLNTISTVSASHYSISATSINSSVDQSTHGLPEFSLKNKIIAISGAAQGLGLTMAEALIEAGAIVYALDRQKEPSPQFDTIASRARALGTDFIYRCTDVRDVQSINTIIGSIADEHKAFHGLIAAAGIQQETAAIDYRSEDIDRMLGVNVTGVFVTAQAAARQMIKYKNGGSIILIASMSGSIANRGGIFAAYNASKGAVVQLTRNLAMEWGSHKIRVNSISPGYILTQMLTDLFEQFPERRAQWSSDNMLGRISTPEEYRGAAVFLLSDASSFMTGADLKIDGGHTAW